MSITRTPHAIGHSQPTARNRRPRRRVILLLLAIVLVWLGVKAPLTAWFGRAPRVIHVGSDWGRGYVAMPQRAGTPLPTRKGQSDRAALLARQRGLAIVADGEAADVSVILKEGVKR